MQAQLAAVAASATVMGLSSEMSHYERSALAALAGHAEGAGGLLSPV